MNKSSIKTVTRTFVLSALLIFTYSINAQDSWIGEYTLGELNDKQISGPEIYVPVRINITKQDGKLIAHLYGKSGNIAIDIYANVVNKGNKINLLYRKVGKYHTWRKKFKKTDLLLSLERTNSTVPNNILTYWGKFTPITEDKVESGKPYFRRLLPENEWVRIETDDKRLSLLFPKNFLVNTEKFHTHWLSVYGFKGGVSMRLTPNSKIPMQVVAKGFTRVFGGEMRRFKLGGFDLIWTTMYSKFEENHVNIFYLQNKKRAYNITVSADSPHKPALKTFISGILIDGKPLVKNIPLTFKVTEKHLISELQTSPEVLEALNQKYKKINRKVTYKRLGKSVFGDSLDWFSQGALIVGFPSGRLGVQVNSPAKVFVQMELRADGQVGDMTVHYSGSKSYARGCANAYKKIKFIPAKVNGRPVNSVYVSGCGWNWEGTFFN